jgi:hypothetical protein
MAITAENKPSYQPAETWDIDPNTPRPEFAVHVTQLLEVLAQPDIQEIIASDQAMGALYTQTINHLKHVSLGFAVREDSSDYVHEPVLKGAYAERPTIIALEKGLDFLDILKGAPVEMTPFRPYDKDRRLEIRALQKNETMDIVNNPLKKYEELSARLAEQGPNAAFPEFKHTVDYLVEALLADEKVEAMCTGNPSMARFREIVLAKLHAVTNAEAFGVEMPYTETILAIERAEEFFDVLRRGQMTSEVPKLYHSDRYEYYMHYLLAQKEHIMFPTITGLGIKEFLEVRGVPIGFLGVNVKTNWVDGYWQTPYEFFHHDINHSRRMWQFFKEQAKREGLSVLEFARKYDKFVQETVMPLVNPDEKDNIATTQRKMVLEILLFEVLHEDALPATPEVIQKALLREPLVRTPFEEIDGDTVVYLMEEGATTLAYAFRKLIHTFYDKPGERRKTLIEEGLRTRSKIVEAAKFFMDAVYPDDSMSDEELIKLLEQLVVTDEGFPDNFKMDFEKDIKDRKDESEGDFAFIVSNPMDAPTTLQNIRDTVKLPIHSLYGYSDLGYANEESIMQKIREDLMQLDPSKVAIAIGATPGGIGKAYEIAKDLGFTTVGIVSSKSLAHEAKYSQFCDHGFIVRDTEWGGYLPGTEDIMAPTTEVFVEISQSIAAYGGGNNTLVALIEAKKRGKSIQYTPAIVNFENAETLGYKGDMRGPVYAYALETGLISR